jgi:hypothetical protein
MERTGSRPIVERIGPWPSGVGLWAFSWPSAAGSIFEWVPIDIATVRSALFG